MDVQRGCLARYGRASRMEWFDFAPELAGSLERGCTVVLQSTRGEELAEVLLIRPESEAKGAEVRGKEDSHRSKVLRIAAPDDHERAKHAESVRGTRFAECLHLLEDGRWPVELLDVELLLDGRTTVVDLFKADDFDLTALRAQFRDWFDFDVILSPADEKDGASIWIPADPELVKASSATGCGSGGCGSGGGCGCRTN